MNKCYIDFSLLTRITLSVVGLFLHFPIHGFSLNDQDTLHHSGMDPENAMLNQARSRYRFLKAEERQMIDNDEAMMRDGYDPNENSKGYPDPRLNGEFPEQERSMRGLDAYQIQQAQKQRISPQDAPF